MRKIKLPFVSRTKYDIMVKNYKILSSARQQLEDSFVEFQNKHKKLENEYSVLLDTNREIGNRMEFISSELDEAKKEIKRLKTILTKNKIKYKKEK